MMEKAIEIHIDQQNEKSKIRKERYNGKVKRRDWNDESEEVSCLYWTVSRKFIMVVSGKKTTS
jgi:hypothetical protein